jgi:hypothetical protein
MCPATTPFVVRIKVRIKIRKGAKLGLPEAATCESTTGMRVIAREQLRADQKNFKEIQARARRIVACCVIRKSSSCHM